MRRGTFSECPFCRSSNINVQGSHHVAYCRDCFRTFELPGSGLELVVWVVLLILAALAIL